MNKKKTNKLKPDYYYAFNKNMVYHWRNSNKRFELEIVAIVAWPIRDLSSLKCTTIHLPLSIISYINILLIQSNSFNTMNLFQFYYSWFYLWHVIHMLLFVTCFKLYNYHMDPLENFVLNKKMNVTWTNIQNIDKVHDISQTYQLSRTDVSRSVTPLVPVHSYQRLCHKSRLEFNHV